MSSLKGVVNCSVFYNNMFKIKTPKATYERFDRLPSMTTKNYGLILVKRELGGFKTSNL